MTKLKDGFDPNELFKVNNEDGPGRIYLGDGMYGDAEAFGCENETPQQSRNRVENAEASLRQMNLELLQRN